MPKSGLLSDLVHVRGNRLDKQGGFRVPARVVVRGCRGSGLHEIEELGRFDAFHFSHFQSQARPCGNCKGRMLDNSEV